MALAAPGSPPPSVASDQGHQTSRPFPGHLSAPSTLTCDPSQASWWEARELLPQCFFYVDVTRAPVLVHHNPALGPSDLLGKSVVDLVGECNGNGKKQGRYSWSNVDVFEYARRLSNHAATAPRSLNRVGGSERVLRMDRHGSIISARIPIRRSLSALDPVRLSGLSGSVSSHESYTTT